MRRSRTGQSLIEVTAGLVVFIPVLLVLIDLTVILYGVQLNDSACHNAVQAAAAGDPSEARYRAQTVIDHVNKRTQGNLVGNFVLDKSVETKIEQSPKCYRDSVTGMLVNPGGPVTGTATVSTAVDIRPFVVYHVYGGHLPLKFTNQQTFPIRYVMPPSQIPDRSARLD